MSATLLLRMMVGAGAFVALTALERKFPLRQPRHRASRRLVVNLVIGAAAFGLVALAYATIVSSAVSWAEQHEMGIVRWLGLPWWIAAPVVVVLLDYTLWVWHWLNHASRGLWRFHAAHHADLDLDTSTALRFHPGELALSLLFRAMQVVVIGASLGALVFWEGLVFVFVQFHHSNLRLPARIDGALSHVIITPRLHGIHHSRRPSELHSNFGTLLSIWDRVHGLRVTEVAQSTIDIGLPHQPGDHALGVAGSLALPFGHPPPRE